MVVLEGGVKVTPKGCLTGSHLIVHQHHHAAHRKRYAGDKEKADGGNQERLHPLEETKGIICKVAVEGGVTTNLVLLEEEAAFLPESSTSFVGVKVDDRPEDRVGRHQEEVHEGDTAVDGRRGEWLDSGPVGLFVLGEGEWHVAGVGEWPVTGLGDVVLAVGEECQGKVNQQVADEKRGNAQQESPWIGHLFLLNERLLTKFVSQLETLKLFSICGDGDGLKCTVLYSRLKIPTLFIYAGSFVFFKIKQKL